MSASRETPTSSARSDDPEPRSPALGTREHIQQTVAQARKTIASARAQTASSESLLMRAEALLQDSERIVQESLAVRAQICDSITAYVHCLRSEKLPPQQVVILLKSAIREATPAGLDATAARVLMEDAVRWGIEAYYQAA